MSFSDTPKDDIAYRREIVGKYKSDVELMAKYIPWLEKMAGEQMYQTYKADGLSEKTIAFPVYDSTLMSLVKDAQRTAFIDRNYVYIYSRNRIHTVEDELKLIAETDMPRFENLSAILSKYILKGMTKGRVWAEGVSDGIYLALFRKMKELILFYDPDRKPGDV